MLLEHFVHHRMTLSANELHWLSLRITDWENLFMGKSQLTYGLLPVHIQGSGWGTVHHVEG